MKKINEIRKEEFITLYNEGYNDYEIAKMMNLSDSTIFRWRKEKRFSPNKSKLLSRNKEIIPSREQLEILTGTLLGDSSLQYYPQYGNTAPMFKCDHGKNQYEYTNLLYEKLQSLNSSFKTYKRKDKRTNKEYTSYIVTTTNNPYFHTMYNQLYSSGKKEISSEFLNNFTIKSLAYLFMDDGYANQKTLFICTDCYSYESVLNLRNHIENNFNLKFSIVKHENYYRLRLSQCDLLRFKELLNPYIIESLKYKLNSVS